MTTLIKKTATKEEIEKILQKVKKTKSKKGLKRFFGLNFIDTGGLDAVAFQKKLRNEWD